MNPLGLAMAKQRPSILCLGVSYPCVETSLARRHGNSPSYAAAGLVENNCRDAPYSIVDCTIKLVKDKVLTQMDARDLLRCQATEDHCHVDVYCVSQEQGAMYRSDRHLDANFNGRHFVKDLAKHFQGRRFDQIVLDYFWIPPAWNQNHWKRSFFERTLVDLVQCDMLRIVQSAELFHGKYQRGAIYLPFCFHCFKEVVATFETLRCYYNISFLRKGELEKVALWSGTQTIDANKMQSIFGKRLDQEETYCSISLQQLKSMEDDPDVSRAELMNIATSLEDFADIRFIVLEPLPCNSRRTRSRKEVSGQFRGLVHPSKVERGVLRRTGFSPTQSPSSTSSFKATSRKVRPKNPVISPSPHGNCEVEPLTQLASRKRNLFPEFEETSYLSSTQKYARHAVSLTQQRQQNSRQPCRSATVRQSHDARSDEHGRRPARTRSPSTADTIYRAKQVVGTSHSEHLARKSPRVRLPSSSAICPVALPIQHQINK